MEPNQTPIQLVPEPVSESKKSLPKWPLIIVGVILLATLLTGAYLLGKNQNVNQNQPQRPLKPLFQPLLQLQSQR